MIPLYEEEKKKSLCVCYRGIYLLEAVVKVFAKVFLNRFLKFICPATFEYSQTGFLAGRGTVNMIFWQDSLLRNE